MNDRIWIPLQGPSGQRPKAPAVQGWQSPGYVGVGEPESPHQESWLGLRCDDLVVVDCDSIEAAKVWCDRVKSVPFPGGYVRKTPRGFHFIYTWTEGSPTAPGAGFLPGLDIRAGSGSQIVFHAPGYRDLGSSRADIKPFDPAWLPEAAARKNFADIGEGWSEMPHGRGNVTMTAFAGAFRKQGMDEKTIRTILLGINKLCMTEAPMPRDDVALIAHSVCRYEPDPDVGRIEVVE